MTPASETTPVAVPELVPAPLAPAPAAPAAPAMHAVQPAAAPESPADEPPIELKPEPGWQHKGTWDHDWIDFHGDRLAIRIPSDAAREGYSIAAGPGSTGAEQLFYTRLFLQKHLSPESFIRIWDRHMTPGDQYEDGQMLKRLVQTMVEARTKPADAETGGSAE